jgi:hypothetical protein
LLSGLLDYVNISAALFDNGQYAESLTACDIGLRFAPELAPLHANRAKALVVLERFDEAIDAAQAALRLDASSVDGLTSLGFAYEGLGEYERGLAYVRAAVAVDPLSPDAHALLASMLLWHGDLRAGLPELEFHWLEESAYCLVRFNGERCWDDGDPTGLRLLLVHNQGLGDFIQMARYFPLLRARTAGLIVECAPAVAALVARVPGVDAVVERGDPTIADRYDAYARVMSLPRLFGTELATIPNTVPYLRADAQLTERWRARIGNGAGLRVGISWGGNPLNRRDRRRSIPLELFAPLADGAGVRWFSLQHGEREFDAAPDGIDLERLGPDFASLDDAAAAIVGLDLVIGVDSSLVHLAGALGKPVWTLVPRRPDWRWLRTGSASAWYPTMRLFRQPAPGDWAAVIADVRDALAFACSVEP